MPRLKLASALLAAASLVAAPVLAAGMKGMVMSAPVTAKSAGKPSPAVQALILTGGWLAATPPGASEAAAYLTLSNPGRAAVTLVGASSPQARAALLMLTATDGAGRLTMQGAARLNVPAGGRLSFAPERAHVMLLDPAPLRPGDRVTLRLRFSDGSERAATLTVRPL